MLTCTEQAPVGHNNAASPGCRPRSKICTFPTRVNRAPTLRSFRSVSTICLTRSLLGSLNPLILMTPGSGPSSPPGSLGLEHEVLGQDLFHQ